jgi:hypothetical protein
MMELSSVVLNDALNLLTLFQEADDTDDIVFIIRLQLRW